MCFPYLFRGTLDTMSVIINEEMKMAAAKALAQLARLPVPPEVSRAYEGKRFAFGPDYIIPSPFDPRLIYTVPLAVAKAAMETGVANKDILDWTEYKHELQIKLLKTSF